MVCSNYRYETSMCMLGLGVSPFQMWWWWGAGSAGSAGRGKPLSQHAHRRKVRLNLKANERFGTLARSTYRRTFGGLILVYVFFLTFCGSPRGINMLGPRCEYIIIVLLLVSVTASSVSGNCL